MDFWSANIKQKDLSKHRDCPECYSNRCEGWSGSIFVFPYDQNMMYVLEIHDFCTHFLGQKVWAASDFDAAKI